MTATEPTPTSPSWWTPALREFEAHLRAANRRPLTIHGYLRDLEQLRAWLIAQERGDELPGTSDLRHWLAELQESGASGATLARKRSTLAAFFGFVSEQKLIPTSPVEGLEHPTHEYELPQTLSRAEVAALLAITEPHPRDHAIFQVLLGCGLRVSEVCALTRSSLDAQALYVAGRVVPVPPGVRAALDRWLAENPDNLVFSIKQRMIRILCEKYRELAGIPREITPSLLRHTCAVWQLVDGAEPEHIKLRFGHEREDVLVHYLHRARQLQEVEAKNWKQATLL